MAATDLTEIFRLHQHIQELDKTKAQRPPTDKEWDVTMQQLVALMGEASKRTMC